jgi:NADH-quinone oxidoreductase subunit J
MSPDEQMIGLVVFFVVAVLAIGGASTLLFHRHPVVASLGMALATLSVGAVYVMLHVPFLGLFQAIVYAGAVMVIVLYVIMALGGEEAGPKVGTVQTVLASAAAVLFFVQILRVTWASAAVAMPEVPPSFGNIQSFGDLLVTTYAVPFEIASLLLVGAMVGAVVLSRRRWE